MKHVFKVPNDNSEEISFYLSFFRKLKANFLSLDFVQIISVLLLLTFGVTFIYSAGQHVGGNMLNAWEKQLMWIGIGAVFWLFLTYSNYDILSIIGPLFYILSIFLLIVVLIIGTKVYGAKRWIDFGGIKLQPSELAKISCLIVISYIASREWFRVNNIVHLGIILILTIVPFLLVLKEPDLGSALIFVIMFAVIVFCSKISWKWVLVVCIACAVIVPSIYPFLHSYQKERILVFFDAERDPMNQGWTSRQTLLSVGSGGFSGKGLLKGTQNVLGFLPKSVSNSDLIFSVIAEESGFVGGMILLFLYMILIYSIIRTAIIARDKFGYLIACGGAALFVEHIYINIGMNIRLMPITGIPLPFISYGGSFMISSMICLGILQSIYIRAKKNSV